MTLVRVKKKIQLDDEPGNKMWVQSNPHNLQVILTVSHQVI